MISVLQETIYLPVLLFDIWVQLLSCDDRQQQMGWIFLVMIDFMEYRFAAADMVRYVFNVRCTRCPRR